MPIDIKNALKVELTRDNGLKKDITNRTLNVDIVAGQREYTGIFDVPEPGIMVLKTVNPDCDPRFNQELGLHTPIEVFINNTCIFTGNVVDIDVEYGAKGEDTVITLTAVDQLGLFSRYNFSEADSNYIRTNYGEVDMEGFLSAFYFLNFPNFAYRSPQTFSDYRYYFAGERIAVKAGDNAYDVFKKLAQSNLWDVSIALSTNEVRVKPYVKYDPRFVEEYDYINPGNVTGVTIFTNTTDAYESYKKIDLNEGLHRLYNQVTFKNDEIEYSGASSYTETQTTYGAYVDTDSKTVFGGAAIEINTAVLANTSEPYVVPSEHFDEMAYAIFEAAAYSQSDIRSITVDAKKGSNANVIADFSTNGNEARLYILHDQNGYGTINRHYNIIGISHSITRNTYECKYILRPHYMYLLNDHRLPTPRFSNTIGTGIGDWANEKTTTEGYSVIISNAPNLRNWKKFWFSAKALLGGFGHTPIQQWYTHQGKGTLSFAANTSGGSLKLAQTSGIVTSTIDPTSFTYAPSGAKKYLLPEGVVDITWPSGVYQNDTGWDFPGDTAQILVTQDDHYWWKWAESFDDDGSAITSANYTLVTSTLPSANFTYFVHPQGMVQFNAEAYFAGQQANTTPISWSITGPANSGATVTSGLTWQSGQLINYQYPNVGTSAVTMTITNFAGTSATVTKVINIPKVHKQVRAIRLRIQETYKRLNNVWDKPRLRQFGQFFTKYSTTKGLQYEQYAPHQGGYFPYNSIGAFEAYRNWNSAGYTSAIVDVVHEFTSPYVTRPWAPDLNRGVNQNYIDVLTPNISSNSSLPQIIAGVNDPNPYLRITGNTSGTTSNFTEDVYVELIIDHQQSLTSNTIITAGQDPIGASRNFNLYDFSATFRTQRTIGSGSTSSITYATTNNPDIYYVPGVSSEAKIWVEVTDKLVRNSSTSGTGAWYGGDQTNGTLPDYIPWTTIGYFQPFLNGAWTGDTVTWSQQMIPIVTLPWSVEQ